MKRDWNSVRENFFFRYTNCPFSTITNCTFFWGPKLTILHTWEDNENVLKWKEYHLSMHAICTFCCLPWRKSKWYFLHLHLVLAGRTADLFLWSWNNKTKYQKEPISSRSLGIIYVRCFPMASRHFIPYGRTIIENRICIILCAFNVVSFN